MEFEMSSSRAQEGDERISAAAETAEITPESSPGAAQPQPGPAWNTTTTQQTRVLFGLEQQQQQDDPPTPSSPPLLYRDDYDKRLPPDDYGQEMAPNARVWRAYEEEAAVFDAALVGQSRDGLDVMLVFAGLFSAVVTSFLIQASNNLQADFSQMTALLLHDIVLMQIEAGGSSNVTVPSANPTAAFEPDVLSVWVNGLWAVSLTASLIVALSAVLVKQWLHHYTTLPSGTPGLRSHVRQFRFMGLEKWRVVTIIGALPIIMHFSLTLFFIGLTLFYTPLRFSLACTIAVISAGVLLVYIASNIMPIIYPECPYHTPFTQLLHYVLQLENRVHSWASFFARDMQSKLGVALSRIGLLSVHEVQLPLDVSTPPSSLLSMRETRVVQDNYDELSLDAVHWLFHMSSNPSLRSVVAQAIGSLSKTVQSRARDLWEDDLEMWIARHDLVVSSSVVRSGVIYECRRGYEDRLERLLRSLCFLDLPQYIGTADVSFAHAPRLQATAWATIDDRVYRHPNGLHDVSQFLTATQDVQMHIDVWRNIIERVCRALDVFSLISTPAVIESYALLYILLVSSWNPYQGDHQGGLLPLRDVLSFGPYRDTILAVLLNTSVVAHHDDHHLRNHSLNIRTANALGRHLVQNLKEDSPVYHELIRSVLGYIRLGLSWGETKIELEAVLGLSEYIMESASWQDSDAGTSDECSFSLTELLSIYADTRIRGRIKQYRLSIPSCRHLVDAGIRIALSSPLLHKDTFALSRHIQHITFVLTTTLADNPTEAMEMFEIYDWPKILCEVPAQLGLEMHISASSIDFIRSYMDCMEAHLGTNAALGPGPGPAHTAASREFFAQPRNLTLLIVSVLCNQVDMRSDIYRLVRRFTELSMSLPSWHNFLSRWKTLCAWCADEDMTSLEFPLNGLFGQTMFGHSRSLDDVVRNRFVVDDNLRKRACIFLELFE